MKSLLWLGLAVCFTYGFFWKSMFEDSYFILQSISFLFISLYLFVKDKCFITYLWLSYCINNMIDELIGNPTVIGINEKVVIIITPMIWFIKMIWNDRQNNK